MFFRRDLTVACQHYPVGLRPPPLLQEGEYPRTACQHYPVLVSLPPLQFRQNTGQNSPFLEGVDFFISDSLWKKTGQCWETRKNATSKKSYRDLPTLPRHFVPPLLQEGEYPRTACQHYSALASATTSTKRGICPQFGLPTLHSSKIFFTQFLLQMLIANFIIVFFIVL